MAWGQSFPFAYRTGAAARRKVSLQGPQSTCLTLVGSDTGQVFSGMLKATLVGEELRFLSVLGQVGCGCKLCPKESV